MSDRAIKDIIDSMKQSIENIRKQAITSIGNTVSEDIKVIYRSKAGLIPYEKMVGDQKMVLSRSTNDMAQAVTSVEGEKDVKIYFNTSDNELLTEARQHEIFGEIRPWKEFRETLMPPSREGKEYLNKALSDVDVKIKISLNTK